jgi:small subunit ribosomal protein S1
MESQNKISSNPMPMPAIDDGWWASVLAEESRNQMPAVPVYASNKTEVQGEAAVSTKSGADWTQVKDLYLRDQIVSLEVTGHNRGGLLVEGRGLYGFVPFSHLVELAGSTDADREKALMGYKGRILNVKVIECVPEDGRVVFSERAAQSEPGKRAELFHSMCQGQHVKGHVTNITDFGVFIDLGGVEGLIHISELSWGRVTHPSQIVKLGEEVEVQVLDLAPERCRVALSLKRMHSNPWENAKTDFPVGDVLPATVTTVVSFGAFARLDAGVEGLIHASEIPLDATQLVKDFLTEGQRIDVRVLHVDADHQRMGLSMRI